MILLKLAQAMKATYFTDDLLISVIITKE